MIISHLCFNLEHLYVINIYSPCNERDKVHFLHNLQNIILNYIPRIPISNFICLEDFNTRLNYNLEIISEGIHNEHTVKELNSFISLLGLYDFWQEENPQVKEYTWSEGNCRAARRLDYLLVELQKSIRNYFGRNDWSQSSIY